MLQVLRRLRRIWIRQVGLKRRYHTWRAKLIVARFGEGGRVNHHSVFTQNTYVGDHANFNGMTIAGNGKVTIGRYFHSGRDCHMITSFHNYDHGSHIPYGPGEDIDKDIEIGDFVWFGDRVIVLGGACIGEGAIVQAGSVVVGDIPALAIAGGHPARAFKYRDREHFEDLKNKGLFF